MVFDIVIYIVAVLVIVAAAVVVVVVVVCSLDRVVKSPVKSQLLCM